MERFQRTISLIGEEAFDNLQNSVVIVFGLGGVGSFAVEALVRSGIGSIVLVDKDVYEESNLNRQWPSKIEEVGRSKVKVIEKECLSISPSLKVTSRHICLNNTNIDELIRPYLLKNLFVIDAIDDIQTKVFLIHYLKRHNVKFISSMGAANVTEIDSIKNGMLNKTTHCPMAKIIRKELRILGLGEDVPVVYSDQERKANMKGKGSILPITASFGLRLANWVINCCC